MTSIFKHNGGLAFFMPYYILYQCLQLFKTSSLFILKCHFIFYCTNMLNYAYHMTFCCGANSILLISICISHIPCSVLNSLPLCFSLCLSFLFPLFFQSWLFFCNQEVYLKPHSYINFPWQTSWEQNQFDIYILCYIWNLTRFIYLIGSNILYWFMEALKNSQAK